MPLEVEIHGLGGLALTILAEPSWSIRELKQHVERKKGIAVHVQALSIGAQRLCNSDLLSGIPHHGGDALRLTLHKRNADQIHWLKLLERPEGVARLVEAPEAIRADFEVMLEAAGHDPQSLKHAHQKLLGSIEFMLAAAKRNSDALQFAARTLWQDPDFVLAAFRFHWRMLYNASEELRSNREFMLQAVAHNRWALQCASDSLKADDTFIEAASAGGRRDYIMDHMRGDGRNLCRAHDFRKDEEIVTAAVVSKGRALEWAAPELQANRAVVMEAVANDPMALEWAAPQLRGDRDIAVAALGQDHRALKYVSPELLADHLVSSLASAQKRRPSSRGAGLSRPSSSVCLTRARVRELPVARRPSRRPRRSASVGGGPRPRAVAPMGSS